ncbi:hypothetical protein A2U01_0112841, partial [Trifolium medium]|nr:hypothetical protein [Trifolium medium]
GGAVVTDTVLVVEGRRRENCHQRFVVVLQSVPLNPPLKLRHAAVKVPSELQRTVVEGRWGLL